MPTNVICNATVYTKPDANGQQASFEVKMKATKGDNGKIIIGDEDTNPLFFDATGKITPQKVYILRGSLLDSYVADIGGGALASFDLRDNSGTWNQMHSSPSGENTMFTYYPNSCKTRSKKK